MITRQNWSRELNIQSITRKVLRLLAAASLVSLVPAAARADFDSPKPRVDCTLKKNKNNAACRPHRSDATDDEIYNAAYWKARTGEFAQALAILKLAKNQDDPRILNETGYSTRKLGNVDQALVFYRRALTINPDFVVARSYLGEAFLSKGDLAAANSELMEIEKRCGTGCTPYANLAGHIADYQATKARGS